ncbi:MAG: hypothetical protein IPN47_22330 [Gemmatimonadetes bacterium]|nr:hypothetical protein [Gemmatimonadota bacterium]
MRAHRIATVAIDEGEERESLEPRATGLRDVGEARRVLDDVVVAIELEEPVGTVLLELRQEQGDDLPAFLQVVLGDEAIG